MSLNVIFTWIYKNFSFCLEYALNWYQRNESIAEVNGSWNRINILDINLGNICHIHNKYILKFSQTKQNDYTKGKNQILILVKHGLLTCTFLGR